MIIQTLGGLPRSEGTIDDILQAMILKFGKDKVCLHTKQQILSFDEHENPTAIKNVK